MGYFYLVYDKCTPPTHSKRADLMLSDRWVAGWLWHGFEFV